MNSRNQKGVNAKAEGLNISFGGDTEAQGDYRGLHTESTACWEAHQKGGGVGGQPGSRAEPGDGQGGWARRHVGQRPVSQEAPHEAMGGTRAASGRRPQL